jgi:Arf-GAP/coiled-coil/ANK repeat/PH domain-containing protein
LKSSVILVVANFWQYGKYLNVCLLIGHTAQVCLLLKHRANQHLKDSGGIKPIDIAVHDVNADIVTL